MKRILSLILAGLMAVSLLAGCSNTDNGGDTNSNQTSKVQDDKGNNKGPDIEEIRKNGLPDNLIDYDADYEEKENDEWKYRDYGTFISILGYKGTSTKIHIPDEIDGKPVLSVYDFYFYNEGLASEDYVSMTMTDNIIHINKQAFTFYTNIDSLKEITLSKNIKKVTKEAFTGIPIEKVVLPEGLEEIDECAFQSCESLKEINFPDSLKFIGYGAFFDTPKEHEAYDVIAETQMKYPEMYKGKFGYEHVGN